MKIVIIQIWEGLGNQLFQYAFARALSEREDLMVYIMPLKKSETKYRDGGNQSVREYGLGAFRITLKQIAPEKCRCLSFLRQDSLIHKVEFICAKHRIGRWEFREETHGMVRSFQPQLLRIKRNTYMKGWFQNENYFRAVRKILLQELTLKKPLSLDKSLQEIFRHRNTVSLHIRRGDYVRLHFALPELYYKTAIANMKEIYPDAFFLVFSDDAEYAQKLLGNVEHFNVSMERRYTDSEELVLMSMCNHNIIANSTFSWWGAWLNPNPDKWVIAPKRWMSTDGGEVIPKDWIRM